MSTGHRRAHGDGGYRRRGDSWELKFPATDPKTGARVMRYHTFKGSETAARTKLRELIKLTEDGEHVAPTKQTFGEVLDAWEKTLTVSAKTAERYLEIVRLHVRPHLGAIKVQNLKTSRIEAFYRDLRDGRGPDGTECRPLAARTITHIHRRVVKALAVAERDGLIESNPARHAARPKAASTEIQILTQDQVRDVLEKLRGRPTWYRLALLGLSTGMRRGELLGLRWRDLDLDRSVLRVEQSLEQTKALKGQRAALGAGLRIKSTKTRHGRRSISLPVAAVVALRALRKEQASERLKLGLGKEPEDALVFRTIELEPFVPNSITTGWRKLVKSLGLPKVSLHAWRHTHASALIDSGMDVLTISRRLGHASPSITLDVYGHRFQRKDDQAAAVLDATFGQFAGNE